MHEGLKQYLRGVAQILSAHYQASKDFRSPSILGTLRERFVSDFLCFFLPSNNEILSGEITDSRGMKSNQQDVVIYDRNMPKLQIVEGPAILLAEGVKATIEIKSRLTWEKFNEALTNVSSVKALKPCINPLLIGERADYISSYVFTYEGPSNETIVEYYNRFRREKNWTEEDFFQNIPDALFVLNGSLFYKNDGFVWKKVEGSPVVRSDPPVALDKFFIHIAISISFPDIFTIDWRSYLE